MDAVIERPSGTRRQIVAPQPRPESVRFSFRPALLRLAELSAIAVIYFIAARLSLYLAFEQTNASPVWPPSGLALAVVLLRGRGSWPGIFIGATLANVVVFLENKSAPLWIAIVVSGVIGVGNTLEALLGNFLLRRWLENCPQLDRARNVFWFVAATPLACLASSSIGPIALCLSGIVPWSIISTVFPTWWLGDMAGILVVTPLFLAWTKSSGESWGRSRFVKASFMLLVLLLAGQLVFGGMLNFGSPLAYLLVPFIVWSAFQLGQRGVTLAALVVSGGAIWGTIHGSGPFVLGTLNEALLALQVFVATVCVTGFFLAAVLSERKRAELGLQKARADLVLHASQLEASNRELETFA